MVIDRAVDRLSWSRSNDVLKVIYIAGNEPFTQGPVGYAGSSAKAARKGIVVNTVFCGSRQEGIATFWKDGADRADGRYMNIDKDEAVAQIDTPFDAEIVTLGNQMRRSASTPPPVPGSTSRASPSFRRPSKPSRARQ
jgi:hypothetical protein